MRNILLRFRDTNENNTIDVHSEIIHNSGFTWWGWWKKDSEPERNDILKGIAEYPEQFHIYLFDRSTDNFFKTKIEKVSFSETEKISSPEKNNTPDYYNTAKLKAWFKFSEISSLTKQNFLELFEIIPNSDHTFFTKEDVINEKKSRVQRIPTKSNYILHLSDIHFGDDFGFPPRSIPNQRSLIDIIIDYVENDLKKQIGLLIISGDITSKANAHHLLNDGVSFINELSKTLKIKKECIVIIPGNHDIPIKDANFQSYNHENTFKIFLNQVYGHDKELYGLELFQFPNGTKLDLLRIHSVKLRSKEEMNYGYVDWFTYKNIANSNKLTGNLKMAVMHHHLVSVPIEETLDPTYPYGSISVTIDSGRVIEGLQKCDIKFVLNGHQHIPGITKISRGMKNNQNEIDNLEEKQVYIFKCRKCGCKKRKIQCARY